MYIVDVESHLKNSGATHGPEREFHERERSACSGLAHPGFTSLPTKLVFFYFFLNKCIVSFPFSLKFYLIS